ncbi:MAG TPA: glycosyltransferase family 4 protein [Rhodanobacter sp.]|nr:glycosyltransferase family 4 protein [Rhodanobacter sp.]
MSETVNHACAGTRPLSTLQIGLHWFASGSGGLDRAFYDLVTTLPRVGVRVQGVVTGPADVGVRTGGQICTLAPAGATLSRRLLGARRTIGDLAASGRFDLVAPHFALHVAAASGHLRHLPLVMHFHGPWAEESALEGQPKAVTIAKRLLEGTVYRRADRVIVLSQAFGELIAMRYGVNPERVRIVPGSVGANRFTSTPLRAEARWMLGWPIDRPILLSVRRLTRRVGLDRLIGAMTKVARCVPDVLLLIGGTGRLEAALRRQVADCALERHVQFLGFVPDEHLTLAYRAAEINVVPSVALEGFGLTAAEALAAGTPSMVTPVGGLPEVVAPLSPDLVFASAEVEDIAAGLVDALRGRLRLPEPSACQAYAAERFDISLAARRTAAVYGEVT